jgi:hypothetical protein
VSSDTSDTNDTIDTIQQKRPPFQATLSLFRVLLCALRDDSSDARMGGPVVTVVIIRKRKQQSAH